MSPVVYREDDSPAWGMMAIVLVVAVFALLIGYFAWWRPANVGADSNPDVINVQPPQPQQPAPSVVPIPVPGPQGPAGPAGPQGPAGSPAPSEPAAPAAPSAPTDGGAITPGGE